MKTFDIRPIASRQELEACYDLWGTVFDVGRAFFQKRLDFDEEYQLDTTWAAFDDGKVAAAIQIFPYHTQIDGIDVLVGGIGNVATSPEYRGHGLAQAILSGQVGYMREGGYDFSLLFTGIFDFYRQIGWDVAYDAIYRVSKHHIPTISVTTDGARVEVLPFNEDHLASLQQIYEAASDGINGAWKRTPLYWRGLLRWSDGDHADFLVAKENGDITAYLRAKMNAEGRLRIVELCALPGHDDAVLSLLGEVFKRHPNGQVAEARLPFNHPAVGHITSWGGAKEAYPDSMWRPMHILSTLDKLKPALLSRVQGLSAEILPNSGWRLLFQTGDEQVLLTVDRDRINISPATYPVRCHKVYTVGNGEWADLLFHGVHVVENRKLKDDPILRALFPPRPAHLSDWDFF